MSTFMISTGVQTHLLTTGDLESAVNGLVFKIYGDATSQSAADALIPDSANDAIGSATLLCTVSVDGLGTGVAFDTTPIDGALYKDATETWKGTNVASGYPSFYRLELSTDDGTESTTAIRFQGTVGILPTKDLVVASSYLTTGEEQRIDNYLIGLPKA